MGETIGCFSVRLLIFGVIVAQLDTVIEEKILLELNELVMTNGLIRGCVRSHRLRDVEDVEKIHILQDRLIRRAGLFRIGEVMEIKSIVK